MTRLKFKISNQANIQLSKNTLQLSTKDSSQLELKWLPAKLRYANVRPDFTYHVISNVELNAKQEDKLVLLLRECKKMIEYNIHKLKGINPFMCMHQLHILNDHKPSVKNQMKLNPNMKKVVKTK